MENCKLTAFADTEVNDAVASCVSDLLTRVASQSQEKKEDSGITGTPVVDSTNGAGSGEAVEEAVVEKEKQIDEISVARNVENMKGKEGPLLEKSTSEDVDGSGEDQVDLDKAVGRMNMGMPRDESSAGTSDSLKTDDFDNSSDENSRRSDVDGGIPEQNGAASNMDGVNVVEDGGRDEGGRESDSKDASVSNSSKSIAEEGSSSTEREESQMRSRTESTPSDRTAGDPDGGYIFGSGGSDYENSSDEFDANEPSTSAAHQEPVSRSGEDRRRRNVERVEEESDDSEVMAQLIVLQNQRLEREAEFRLLETPYHEAPCRRLSFGSTSSDESVNIQNDGVIVGADGANGVMAGNVAAQAPVGVMLNRKAVSDSELRRLERRKELNENPREARVFIKRSSSLNDLDAQLERKRRRVMEPEVVQAAVNLARNEVVEPELDDMNGDDAMEIDDNQAAVIPVVNQVDVDVPELDEIEVDDNEAANDVDGDDDGDDAASNGTSVHTAIELRRSTRITKPIDRWSYDHHIPKRRPRRAGGVQKRRRSRKPRRRVPQLPTPPPPPPVPRPAPFVSRMLPVLPPAPAPVAAIVGVIGTMDEIVEAVEEIEDLLIQFDYGSRQLDIILMLRRLQGQLAKFETTVPTDEQKKKMMNAVARIKAMMGAN